MAEENTPDDVDQVDDPTGEQHDRDDEDVRDDDRDQRRRARGLDDEDDDRDAEHLGDAGKRALERMKRERKAARDELEAVKAELRKYQDKDKSESERLTETAQTATARAEKAETSLRALQAALEHAPEWATFDQIRYCAKRLRGESDEELEADATEFYELIGARKAERPKPAGKPRERLRPGSTDPDEPIEETDPKRLAAMVPRG